MWGWFIVSTWLSTYHVSCAGEGLYSTATSGPFTESLNLEVSLWVNANYSLWTDSPEVLFTLIGPETLTPLLRTTTHYSLSLSKPNELLPLLHLPTEHSSSWELIHVTYSLHDLTLCLLTTSDPDCVSASNPPLLWPRHVLISMSYKSKGYRICVHRKLWTVFDYIKDWENTQKLQGQIFNNNSRLFGDFKASGISFWTKRNTNFAHIKVEIATSRLTFSLTDTSFCVLEECIQYPELPANRWVFLYIEVRSEIRMCVLYGDEDVRNCWSMEKTPPVTINDGISVLTGDSLTLFKDVTVWTESEEGTTWNSAVFYEEKKQGFGDMQGERKLQSAHYALFSHTIPSTSLPDTFFTFENTHLSTQFLTITASTTGPISLLVYLNYLPGATPNWSNSSTDSCSVSITGAGSGRYTVNVQTLPGVTVDLVVRIECNEVTLGCYCPTGEYPDPDIMHCSACPGSDLQCQFMTDLACLPTDIEGGTPGFNCMTCPEGQYSRTDSGLCSPCAGDCFHCQGPGSTDCLSCHPNAELSASAAPSVCICSNGFYPAPNASLCSPCDLRCSLCSDSGNDHCSGCTLHASLTGSTCDCDGGYVNIVTGCVACLGLCATCTQADASFCLSCVSNAALSTSPGPCACLPGYYLLTLTCQPCSLLCPTCTGPLSSDCLTCPPNSSLTSSSPSPCHCNPGYYPSPNVSNCMNCDVRCSQCFAGDNLSCSSCTANASLAGTTCTCDSGFALSLTGCRPCPGLCATCAQVDASQCLSCVSHASLVGSPGPCTCIPGYYYDVATATCPNCSPHCHTCAGPLSTDCLTCPPNSSLTSSSPSPCQCNPAFYPSPNPSNCLSCDPSCKLCLSGGSNGCSACESNADLTGGACICSNGYYPSPTASNCVLCDVRCSLCTNGGNMSCSACTSNASLTVSTCDCDYGFSYSPTGCLACSGLCLTCSQPDSTHCLTCIPNASVSLPPGPCTCQTGFYYASTTVTCPPCSSQCHTCSGPLASNCLTCPSNSSLLTTAPSACQCNPKFYPAPNTSNCGSCDPTCVLCTTAGVNGCSTCESNAYLVGGACICNTGRVFSVTSSLCEVCHSTCQTCSDGTGNGCMSCYSHAELSSGACICSISYYGSPTSCQSCHPLCQNCTGPNSTQCTSCNTLAVLNGSAPTSCICIDGAYLNTVVNICTPCLPQCATCVALSTNQCISCPANSSRTNAVAVSSPCACNSGYYPNTTVANCQVCSVTCKTCTGGTASDCASCYSNTNLSTSGVCKCQTGYFPDPNESNCSACDPTCYTCLTSATNCQSCKSYAHLSGSQCICDSNAYPSPTASNCRACHYTCASCSSGLINNCLTCLSNAFLTGGNKCQCESNYFPSPAANNCVMCYVTCLTCSGSSSSQCMTCFPSAYLTNGSAPSTCSCTGSHYGSPNASNCLNCSNTCDECNGPNTNQCTQCKNNTRKSGGVCICLDGYYQDAAGDCQLCDVSCKTCTGPGSSECVTCSQPGGVTAPAVAGTCTCVDPVNNPCYTCITTTCQTCIGPTVAHCISCYSNAHITSPTNPTYHSGRCVCDVAYFGSPDNCQPCHITCRYCSGPADTQCTQCYGSTRLSGGVCSCRQTYFPNPTSKDCSSCHTTCYTCQTALSTDCLSCFTNASLSSPTSPTTCTCDNGYYTLTTSRNCVLCDPTCLTCSGSDISECTSCKANAVFSVPGLMSSCVCVTGFYFSTGSGKCENCDMTCVTCYGGSSSNCLTCFSNASESSGTCKCQTHYFPNPDASICSSCDLKCYKCNLTSDNCTSCYSNALLVTSGSGMTCQCAPSYMPNPDVKHCQACYFECLSCSGTTSSLCTSCYPHASIPSGVSTGACACDQGYFPDSTAVICSPCPVVCKACTSLDNCTLCFTGGVTYLTASNQRSCKCTGHYYPNPTASNCTQCDDSCVNCTGGGVSSCTSCGSNTTASGGQCVCLSHFYRPAGTANCSVCASTCTQCAGSSSGCTQCYSNAQLAGVSPNTCICSPGYFASPTSANCVPCEVMCTQCIGYGQCSTCIPHASVTSTPGPCICDIAYFYISASNVCFACNSACKTCSERLNTNCLSCYGNAGLVGSGCVCVAGYYPSPDAGNCMPCDGNCVTCTSGASSTCTLCGSHASLLNGITPGTCTCDPGYWPASDATHCSLCHNQCVTCVSGSSTTCMSCHTHASLGTTPGQCICNQGYYMIVSTGLCGGCNSRCLACVNSSASDCIQCKSNASLVNGVAPGTCLCNPGYYPNSTPSNCTACHITCLTCTSGTLSTCTSCKPHASLTPSNTCSCDIYYYPDPDSSSCSMCHITCTTCVSGTINDCLTCKSHASVVNPTPDLCICDEGYYPDPDSSQCKSCHSTCKRCVAGTDYDCTACFSFASLSTSPSPSACLCITNYFPASDSSHCVPCHISCPTCINFSSTDCLSCFPRAHLTSSSPSSCICDLSYFPDSDASNCQPCHSTCFTCLTSDPYLCTQCKDFAVLKAAPGQCYCSEGAYPAPDASACRPCHPTCRTCIGPGDDKCMLCMVSADFSAPPPTTCHCNTGFYPSPDSSQCVACRSDCLTCVSSGVCSSCYPNAELTDGVCACRQSFYPSPTASHCVICMKDCLSCTEFLCIRCIPGYYLLHGTCVSTCPLRYRANNEYECMEMDLYPPIPSLYIHVNNSISVQFDVDMNCTVRKDDISIDGFGGNDTSISLDWKAPVFRSNRWMDVDISYDDAYVASESWISVVFLAPERVVSVYEIPINVTVVTGRLYQKGSALPSTTITQTQTMATSSVVGSMTASVVVSSPSSFLTTFNIFQLIAYLPLSSLPLTPAFSASLTALNAVNMIPNPMIDLLTINDTSQTPSALERDYGLQTTLLYPNLASILTISGVVLMSYFPVMLLSKVPNGVISRYFRRCLGQYKYAIPLHVAFTIYLDAAIFSMLQVSHTHLHTPYTCLSTLSAYLLLALVMLFPLGLTLFFLLNSHNIQFRDNQKFNSVFNFFTNKFDIRKKYAERVHFVLFLSRRLVLSSSIFLLRDYPKYFSVLNSAFSCLVMLYMFIAKPYESKVDMMEALVVEGGTTVIYVIAGCFAFGLGQEVESALDEMGVWAVRTVIAVSIVTPLIRFSLTLIKITQEYRSTLRSQVTFADHTTAHTKHTRVLD